MDGDRSILAWVEKTPEGFDLYIGSDGKINIPMANKLFKSYSNVTTIDFNDRISTENTKDMSEMFYNCWRLTKLDLSCFDTKNCTNMSQMFSLCSKLQTLDISSFNTENVTDFSFMFSHMGLTELDLSKFSAQSATSTAAMFSGSKNLTSIDLSGFNPSASLYCYIMFNNCENLTTVVTNSEVIKNQLRTDLPEKEW